MLKRKIIKKLKDWKADNARKSLIIEGPHQIGKTFVLRSFVLEHYKQVVDINFNQYPYMKHIFEQDLEIDALIFQISLLIKGARCVPFETLILLDEIDHCPSAMNALIKFSSDSRYDCIATRTLLKTTDNPVEVTVIRMHALDFEEFLWANSVSTLAIQELRTAFIHERPISTDLHLFFMDMFRYYTAIGGMPKSVRTFLKTFSYDSIRLAQRYTNDIYLNDIISQTDLNKKSRAIEIFHSIPEQVRKGNRKFKYSDVSNTASYRTHWDSILKLYEFGWLYTIFKVDSLDKPLFDNRLKGNFKICVRDIGCLVGLLNDGDVEYLNQPLTIQNNIVLENSVADVCVKRGLRMYYMEKGKHYFFVATNNDRNIGLSFDDSYTLAYMNRLVEQGKLDVAYDLIVEPMFRNKSGLHIPLYALMFIE